jgi:hypothetical protein
MNNKIKDAINNKAVLTFNYHGFPRTVEPHTYGIDTKGHIALSAYQTHGRSEGGKMPPWRLFHENDIIYLNVTKVKFSSARQGYVRDDPAFSTIYAQI